jgi:hypothetical protein
MHQLCILYVLLLWLLLCGLINNYMHNRHSRPDLEYARRRIGQPRYEEDQAQHVPTLNKLLYV